MHQFCRSAIYADLRQPSGNQIRVVAFQTAHLAKCQMLQNICFTSFMWSWHNGFKDHEIWISKVNFLSQKPFEAFRFFFHLEISM